LNIVNFFWNKIVRNAYNDCCNSLQIKPLSGPIEGGTLITIEGSNLGLKEEDVRGKIRIGNSPCELVNYQVSVRIECRTGPAESEMVASVIVGNDAGYTESMVHFSYKVKQFCSHLLQNI
jgi:hypothetical protein